MNRAREDVPRRMIAAVALATLLNPLNSSMIAVALVPIQAAFRASVDEATWLISAFYLAGAVGQPLMGRLADQLGARRIFVAGLALAGVTGSLAPLAPSIAWLAGIRALQALATSAAYPAGMAMVRARAASGPQRASSPAGTLAVFSIVGNVSAGLGPTLGGLLVEFGGWPAIFLVNVPAAALGVALALRWLPNDPSRPPASVRGLVGLIDPPGVALFCLTLGGLLGFLLSLSGQPRWVLLPVAPISAALLVWWELRAQSPFLNVRMLALGGGLASVYAQFTAVNVAYYSVFFGLPLWLEKVRDVGPGEAGLIVMPLSGVGVLTTAAAAGLIRRWGPRLPLVLGAAVLCVGAGLLLLLGGTTPWAGVVAVVAVLGLPVGLLNLSLQALLFQAAPRGEMGAASGLFQTCRYVGSVLSTSLLGVLFAVAVTSAALHSLAIALAAIGLLLLGASAALLRAP